MMHSGVRNRVLMPPSSLLQAQEPKKVVKPVPTPVPAAAAKPTPIKVKPVAVPAKGTGTVFIC